MTAEHEREDEEDDEEEGDEEVSDAVKEEDGEWSQFVKESSSGEREWRMERALNNKEVDMHGCKWCWRYPIITQFFSSFVRV